MKRNILLVIILAILAATLLYGFQAADTFSGQRLNLQSPAASADAVTPDDDNDLTYTCRALYIGGDGAVKVDMPRSAAITFAAVPAGTVLPIRVDRVYATGTAATNIVCIY